MPSHRTPARGILFLLLAVGLTAAPAAARTSTIPPPPSGAPAKGPQPQLPARPSSAGIVFPVVGPVTYSDDFGDPRAGGRHEGNDVMAPKRALAVAAEAGKVKFWTTSAQAGCMLYLYGASGTTYLYIHLNNDLGSGNDNRGSCVAGTAYAKGLKSGASVEAGQPIGYVGDSGDANGIHPHLHFEVHPGDKGAVDPYPYLRKARHLLFAARPGTTVSLTLKGAIVSSASGKLGVKVGSLAASTGLRVGGLGATVMLDLPVGTPIQSVSSLIGVPRLARGRSLTVTTLPEPVTLEAELGLPGALTVSTVTLS